jgi:hypothetical protein
MSYLTFMRRSVPPVDTQLPDYRVDWSTYRGHGEHCLWKNVLALHPNYQGNHRR